MLFIIRENMNFGDWLQQELDRRKWQQADLHHHSHGKLTRSTISNLVRGEKNPSIASCNLIADAMNIAPETVFRAAGYLPRRDNDLTLDAVLDLMRSMSVDERREILALATALKRHRRRRNYDNDGNSDK